MKGPGSQKNCPALITLLMVGWRTRREVRPVPWLEPPLPVALPQEERQAGPQRGEPLPVLPLEPQQEALPQVPPSGHPSGQEAQQAGQPQSQEGQRGVPPPGQVPGPLQGPQRHPPIPGLESSLPVVPQGEPQQEGLPQGALRRAVQRGTAPPQPSCLPKADPPRHHPRRHEAS